MIFHGIISKNDSLRKRADAYAEKKQALAPAHSLRPCPAGRRDIIKQARRLDRPNVGLVRGLG
jgi:hypothetical protein